MCVFPLYFCQVLKNRILPFFPEHHVSDSRIVSANSEYMKHCEKKSFSGEMGDFVSLTVEGTTYFLKRVHDDHGWRFICEDITAVIDPRYDIRIEYDGCVTEFTGKDMSIVKDAIGNDSISVSLSSRSGNATLCIRGIFEIDDAFLNIMYNTPLFSLVEKKRGCLAVSTFEVLDNL